MNGMQAYDHSGPMMEEAKMPGLMGRLSSIMYVPGMP